MISKEELLPHLNRFGPYLRVERGLGARSRDLYVRILQKFLLDVGTTHPTKDMIYARLNELYENDYSHSHVRNIQISIEYYMAFLGTPLELKRLRKRRNIVGSVLTEAEVAILIAASKNVREKAITSLLACSGLRNQELCDLRVRDVDFNQNLVRVRDGKGGSAGYSIISPECVSVLAQYLQAHPRKEDSFLFTTIRCGDQYSTTALRRLIKQLAERAKIGKRVHPHLFRHALASNLLKRGATPLAVQQQLRHAHLSTTLLYIHSGHGGNCQREIAYHQPAYL